jgi:hypothetical protein
MKKLLSGLFGAGMPDFDAIIEAAYQAASSGFVWYAIVGFLLAIIALLLINLVSFIRPKTRLFRAFNYVNFLYLPVLFVFVFGTLGAWSFSKNYAVEEIHEEVLPSVKMIFPAFQLYLNMNDETLRKEQVDLQAAVLRFASIISITTTSESWVERKKVEIAKKEIPLMLYRAIDAVVQTEIEQRGNPDNDILLVATNMSFFRPTDKFWSATEEKLVESTKSYFNTKLLGWFIYSLFASSFLLFQLVLVVKKK